MTKHRDMANIDLDWEVEGIIQVDESVRGMLRVTDSKGKNDTGTFWCWDGRVRTIRYCPVAILTKTQEHPW